MRGQASTVPPKPSLLALQCADLDATAAFYEDLDFVFTEEQHGSDPRNLAYPGDGWVLELHPLATGDRSPPHPPRLGLRADDLPRVLSQVGQGTIGDDGHAVVVDPDGRKVDLVAHEAEPRVSAWLVLSTPDPIDLSFVGPLLGRQSRAIEVAGQPRAMPTGRQSRTPRTSSWSGETVVRRTSDVHDVVVEVLGDLDAVRDVHLKLLRDHGLTAAICVSVRTDDATAVGTLDRSLLRRLVDLEVELDLNLYVEG
ncbi:DUF4279 domain-containing protein [Aquihabitans sp. G128]|uniref:DUF4279 domain-containing protein n=1 Tax=Aquihabitans sp. G128 TaxID=2849779 RepID=UPI001C2249C5|nr:DUF4279 domain-containing protein [Aquihabitans sp. G128]QXC60967.1 DUF4279 domain-containing protein [Aquihabitans sp. G128]